MVRVSNSLISILNIVAFIISIPIIGASIWLRVHSTSECNKFFVMPLVIIGVFLLIISLLGLVGSCCHVTFFLWIYLFLMFLLIVGVFSFAVFSFIVTNKGVGDKISGRGFHEYRLGNYSHWLQKNVANGKNWVKIKSCLIDAQVCRSPRDGVHQKSVEFYKENLSQIQSGCCKPPSHCGFEYKNVTFWAPPKAGILASDIDCVTWSNHQGTLCSDCMSCKAGVLEKLKSSWRKLAIFNVCVFVFLIIVYAVGCCAVQNDRYGHYNRYRRDP